MVEELGSFVRVSLIDGSEFDFDLAQGAQVRADYKSWHNSGNGYTSFFGTTICGSEIDFPICNVVSIFTSTPETRQAVRERLRLFEKESESTKDWST